MIKPVLQSVLAVSHRDLRGFAPDDPNSVVERLLIYVGERRKKGGAEFSLLLATPKGLAAHPVQDNGILASGKMLVVPYYDYDVVWRWLEETAASCYADSWDGCIERLSHCFDWEFQGYREGP